MKTTFTAAFLVLIVLQSLVAAADPLKIPDTDEGVPGAGPLRRTEWFRGMWRERRGSWLDKSNAQKRSVVFLGDSITQGWGDDFKGAFKGLRVVNRGINGDTSRGLLLRLKEDVIALEPQAVVLMIGANDLAEKAPGDVVFGNVKLIIEALKAHNAEMAILLCETFPCAPDDYRPVAEIRKINALYAKTWSDDPKVILAKTYSLFAGDDGAALPKYLPDRVHPNAEGYAKWAAALRPIFAKLGFGDTTPDPLAWIHFNRFDRKVALYNNFYMYYTDRKVPLEFTIDVPPDPAHKLAFQWVTKDGPVRSMTIEVNGKPKTVSHPSRGNGNQAFFWDALPVTEFGIKEQLPGGGFRLRILCPKDAQDDGVLAGIRLITDDAQLEPLKLSTPSHKVTFVSPGSMSEAERAALLVGRAAARQRVHVRWVGEKALTEDEIAADEFLAAAARFGDTAITHGRDVYGPVKTPMFVRFLHRELLKSPASLGSLTPALGGPPQPVVQTQFDRSQNLLRTLAGLSQTTGDPKYAEAAMEAVIHMFEEYATPGSGLIIFGNHMTIDLTGDRAYSDGRSGDIFELEDVFPFYDFLYSVEPSKTEHFVKGCWEVYVRDWHTMHYNRHASFTKNVDFTKTWERPLLAVNNLPENMEVLGFIDVGLDLAFGGYSLGCLQDDAKPRQWANRYLEVLSYHRDPTTKIWPMLLYTPTIRRNLEVYREAFPQANVTEPRVIISSWIYNMPVFFLGALGTIEQGDKHGHADELAEVHRRIDDWILGYMAAAYDRERHTMRSIILDGTDVTDHVFQPGKVLHGWGAKERDSFVAHPTYATFHAAVARAYRLADGETRKRYWPLLRDLFQGAGLGDLGAAPDSKPAFQFDTESDEPAYIFALVDLYRVHRQPETLKFMEHLGRNLIARRQDPNSGLFSLPPHRLYTVRHNQRTKEPYEHRTVRETLRSEFDYDRPKVVSLDVNDPLALLAIHGCRTGEFRKIPQWLSGGQWGAGGVSAGHMIDHNLERWFDRAKLEAYYDTQRAQLEEKGYVVGKNWYPN